MLLGVLPAMKFSSANPREALNTGIRGNTDARRGGNIRSILIGTEVTLGTVLLVVSALLLASLNRILGVPRGFEASGLLATDISLPVPKYQSGEKQAQFAETLRRSLATLPGVQCAAAISSVPLDYERHNAPVIKEDSDRKPGDLASWSRVSASYFETMKISLLDGHVFYDGTEPEKVAVVSEAAAHLFWPGENPIGKKVAHAATPNAFYRVVGVVSNVRAEGPDQPSSITIYRVLSQCADTDFSIVMRTALPSQSLDTVVRNVVSKIDPEVSAGRIHSMKELVDKSVEQRRFQAVLLSTFAALAALLSALGIYGVVAHVVLERRKEVGVRMVLGAEPKDVRALMFRYGMAPVFAGLGAGVALAAVVAHLIGGLLFEVGTLDPASFLAARC